MIDTPEIIETEPRLCAVIHLHIPKDAIRKEMGPGIAELRAAVEAQGIAAPGAWFTHHSKMDPAFWDFEIGVPVTKPVKPVGRVTGGELPARRVARTTYRGGYEGLGDGWGELMQWIEKSGHRAAPDLWEIYAVGPESGSEPGKWQTELYRPLLP
ncbi:MAG TPA: GyrI-like domain-containing protein [Polyangiaceae bacterium]|nr:GyrI-like domain-containing protein [Polyangiaceae bacterium]